MRPAPLHILPTAPLSVCMPYPAASDDFLNELKERLRRFSADRDWDQFHSPKNLAMALIVEAGELVEHFQWLSAEKSAGLSTEQLEEVRLEMADVLIYLVRLADRLDVDLADAVDVKIDINETKYPANRVRGDAGKYREYRDKGAGQTESG